MSRGLRNNNPGNIRISSSNWQGKITPSKDKEFEQFTSMAYGYRAIFCILRTYIQNYQLKTIPQIVERWAPRNENNTDAYIDFVVRQTKIERTATFDHLSYSALVLIVAAVSQMENGTPAVMADVEAGWKLYIGK